MAGQSVAGPFAGLDIHLAGRPNDTSLRRYRHIPPGGNRFDLPWELRPPCWQRKSTGTTDVMGRLEWDKPSVTIRTEFYKPEKGRYLHPQYEGALAVHRALTHLEAARLQDFPDTWRWYGTRISIARQIGNAVPVKLAEAVAGQVRRHLEDYGLVSPLQP